jgi:hypothetical protein
MEIYGLNINKCLQKQLNSSGFSKALWFFDCKTPSKQYTNKTLIVGLFMAVTASTDYPIIANAQAASNPKLGLSITGPQTTTVGNALKGLTIKLANTGQAAQNSKLRLLVHHQADYAIKAGDIKIDVLEQRTWQPLQVELIDSGIMGVISETGKSHNRNHKHGGFAIPAKKHQTWQIRITFAIAGSYNMVVAVSPDNGSTHLAQPVSYRLEAL